MPEARSVKCPNCSAPMTVPLGETEMDCDYCDSRIRFLPGSDEMEVVRSREELKTRERARAKGGACATLAPELSVEDDIDLLPARRRTLERVTLRFRGPQWMDRLWRLAMSR